MLLNEQHMARQAGGVSLRQAIADGRIGDVELIGERLLWRVPPEKLLSAQGLLDESDVSLSGRRLEGLVRGAGLAGRRGDFV